MMSKLTRLHEEALRLLTTYEEHKNSTDEHMRRKAHLDLDRFLMEHREVAAILFVGGLQVEIEALSVPDRKVTKAPWYRRFIKGGKTNVNRNSEVGQAVHYE